jgi:hypothetical protein
MEWLYLTAIEMGGGMSFTYPYWLLPAFAVTRRRRIIRKYLVIYGGPCFLAVVWFGSTPTPTPTLPSVRSTSEHTGRLRMRDNFWRERGEAGGRGAESYGRKKAWSSINHSIFFVNYAISYLIPILKYVYNLELNLQCRTPKIVKIFLWKPSLDIYNFLQF